MNILQAIIIGLIQGLTEFLPVSSSAHLIFTQQVLGVTDVGLAFDVLLHLGSLIAVIIYFFNDIITVIKKFFSSLIDLKEGKFLQEIKKDHYKKFAWLTILATIPVGIVGVLFNDLIESLFKGLIVPAFLLLITGCLLYSSKRINNNNINIKNISFKQSFFIGCGQALAVLPGLSRSGTTIAAGLFAGLDKEFATKFSFILSIPAIFGASLFQLKDLTVENINLLTCFTGFIVSIISGYLAINFLFKIIREKNLDIFAYYCWIIGITVLVVSLIFKL